MMWAKPIGMFVLVSIMAFAATAPVRAQEKLFVAYGGQNETVAPMWAAVDKGLFKKYGLDVNMVQMRSGQFNITALMSGDVQAIWPAISSVLNGVSGGAKINCVASPFNRIARELIVRPNIDSLAGLRNKIVGVQSIGGGFWLQTMIVLNSLGIDPDKNGLQMRVIGDEPTILQALLSMNIDAAVITYASAAVAKRAGLKSLANTAELKVPYQGVGICARSQQIAAAPEFITKLMKGMIEGVAFVQEPSSKREVMEILKTHLRLNTLQDAETSYNTLRLVSTFDVAPDPAAWRNIQNVVARVSPKVAQLDIHQIIDTSFVKNLEQAGFIAEMKRRAGM